MIPELEEIELGQGNYCKAGFRHQAGDTCGHIAALPGVSAYRKNRFTLSPDYYSEEAMAKRREANKIKYAPKRYDALVRATMPVIDDDTF